MQTGAHVGMHVVSKTLSDRYLRAANERIFSHLGLRARLCNTPALRLPRQSPGSNQRAADQAQEVRTVGRRRNPGSPHFPL